MKKIVAPDGRVWVEAKSAASVGGRTRIRVDNIVAIQERDGDYYGRRDKYDGPVVAVQCGDHGRRDMYWLQGSYDQLVAIMNTPKPDFSYFPQVTITEGDD